MPKKKAIVLFASAIPKKVDRDLTLPAKFQRLLDRMPIIERVNGRKVAIKMHLGGGLGYSTIHPLFVKLLVDHVKKGKPRSVFVTDGSVKNASDRGYAKETVGARLLPAVGTNGKDVITKRTGWTPMKTVEIGKPIADADVLLNFSHAKGHGACGYGGACKNLAMGCVPDSTRAKMHGLEGSLEWVRDKCIRCDKCIKECTSNANSFNKKGEYNIFWHHCRLCLHCMMVCPTGAIRIENRKFDLFQEGLARTAKVVLDTFKPGHVFNINVLSDITIWCDCWGLTTPSLVPDIGIMASEDIVAVDQATLKAIKTTDLIPGSITPPYKLGKGRHLFEKLHGKDPFCQVRELEKLGAGTASFLIEKVR